MHNLNDRELILQLAKGKPKHRRGMDIDDVRAQIYLKLNEACEKLELIYDLTFLEGSLNCDDFHLTKRTFDEVGENYGYIHSFTERNDKTNVFRFQYRRPLANGSIIRESISMNRVSGTYSRSAFKRAGHELEKDLCMMTEKYYFALRKRSKAVRSVLRILVRLNPKSEN